MGDSGDPNGLDFRAFLVRSFQCGTDAASKIAAAQSGSSRSSSHRSLSRIHR